MADAPVVFKRSKPKHAQRARISTLDPPAQEDAGADIADRADSPSVLAAKLKNKAKSRTKPKSTLSFGGDEEEGDGEVFQLKKSNLSRKLTLNRQSGNTLSSSFDPLATSRPPETPKYDAAYLSQLKASTPTSRPQPPPGDDSISYDDVDMSVDVDLLQGSTPIIDLSGEVDTETVIPSNSSVLAAKQKRERLRAGAGVEEDFISLSVSKRSDFSQGPHPESRLVREEDELGDADDEFAEYTSAQERIALGKKSRKVEAKKRRDEMNEMIVDAEEQDEETMEWELEQLRRGGLKADQTENKAAKLVYKPAPIPPVTPIPTLGAAVARLTQQLTALTTSHAQNTASMTALDEEQAQLEVREKEMREMIAKAEEKRSWFAAFREWVESVATFLDEKYPQLEKLEEDHVSLLKEKAEMITQRRTAEDEDDLSLFLGSLPQAPVEEQFDELGRLVPQANPAVARRDRTAARAARRTRRHASERSRNADAEEGFSTDSSLAPSDASDYETAMQKLLTDVQDIMSDVKAEEFRSPDKGLGRWFDGWRSRFGESYTGAWGGLGMVGAWEFWTRLEILGWNPLENTRSLDSFAWYHSLYRYSRPRQEDDDDEGEEAELGPDGDLVSAMISSAVIPRLCKIIEGGGFDPYSSKDIRRLTDLAEEIELSVDKNSLKFEVLLKSIYTPFHIAVDASISAAAPYLTLNSPRFDPDAIPARRRFLNRRSKLLRNIVSWRRYSGEKYGIGLLVTRLLEQCMLPVADGGWEVGGEECIRKTIQHLPGELVPTSVKARLGNF